MRKNNTALVLGATGGIGGEVACQLRDAGWDVRALRRGQQNTTVRDGITWIGGDALNRDDVMGAARGCSVIVHAVNPPGYRHWAELVLPMLDNTIAAATAQSATIVLPGTVYNFGPDAFPELREDSPQRPLTRKGAIRVELEQRLRLATAGNVRAILVRAGDFFGPKPGNSWFSQGLVKPGQTVNAVNLPGRTGVGHQWSYLPDVARTMVELLARRDSLEPFAVFHMAGHWDADGAQMANAIRRVAARRGGDTPKLRAFPWWLLTLASPFVTTFRELREMRYLWREPVRMSNDKLKSVLGAEPHTPLDEAVESALDGLGCLAPAKATTSAVPVGTALALAAALAIGAPSSPGQARVNHIDTAAPVISRNEIFIAAPVETVWAVQTDISAWTQWRPTVTAAHLDGELKAGSAFKWEEGGLKITSTVQELIPMRRIVWTGPAQGIDAVHKWEFIRTNGGVRVRTEESWSGNVVNKNAVTLQPMLDRALQDWLTRLKATSEARSERPSH
ncbi:nucleoside-diphosphate-sugar epimerase/uncharacterized protein YndB with AHSA1/START domain [Sphingobium sp. B1D7B]|uniref:SRPBCC family protein n=1 Tax=unclassified Sphingobium TaxID=2611147 RepID=UPI002225889E|nr:MULTISPECIES: SRPBCC family protein [unclassified Sphingobium]MCW2392422.1 nucleoside-diphosphate-sugar epimerase/uncharacterized protein YndB with AHSA1/START domain [Sphingobium sp. B11D3A]MCW2404117.1 nucleoside-diphosphate-sugar epimerase/uncharacterized protein YndB with AHSA1/START domain [Sphingobium sp. B1D7B]